jgi:hypothetical protein
VLQGLGDECGERDTLAANMASMSRLRQGLAEAEQRLAKVMHSPPPQRDSDEHMPRDNRSFHKWPECSGLDEAASAGTTCNGGVQTDVIEPKPKVMSRRPRRNHSESNASLNGECTERASCPHNGGARDVMRERAERAETQADRLRMRAAGAEREAEMLRAKVCIT